MIVGRKRFVSSQNSICTRYFTPNIDKNQFESAKGKTFEGNSNSFWNTFKFFSRLTIKFSKSNGIKLFNLFFFFEENQIRGKMKMLNWKFNIFFLAGERAMHGKMMWTVRNLERNWPSWENGTICGNASRETGNVKEMLFSWVERGDRYFDENFFENL